MVQLPGGHRVSWQFRFVSFCFDALPNIDPAQNNGWSRSLISRISGVAPPALLPLLDAGLAGCHRPYD